MRTRQFIRCVQIVLEGRIPTLRSMTRLAIMRKLNFCMVRGVRNLIVGRVTRPARLIESIKQTSTVAFRATRFYMTTRQRKVRNLMIEVGRPVGRCVTLRTAMREVKRYMIRCHGRGKVVAMTIYAHRRRDRKGVFAMTLRTSAARMSTGEREGGRVHELVQPPIRDPGVVTALAGSRKPSHDVAGIGSFLIVVQMARHTCRFKSGHLAVCMTRLTIKPGVLSDQRESRLGVLALHRQALVPAVGRVTLLATVAKLSRVYIGMAGNTRRLCVRENQIRVARQTRSSRMAAGQGELRGIMGKWQGR